MSAVIYIMRHGIAEDTAPSGDDADRRLTPEGKRKVVEIARGLKAIEVRPEVVLSSRLPRAMETATLVASVLDDKLEVGTFDPLTEAFDAEGTVSRLSVCRGAESVMLVGHQPHLGEVASILLTGGSTRAAVPFKKGGVAAFEVDALPPSVTATLLWFMTPKQLRNLH